MPSQATFTVANETQFNAAIQAADPSGAGTAQSGSPAAPGGRRRVGAWAAWAAAGIVLALMAAGVPAAYAASGTVPPTPSSRSGTPPAAQKSAKGTQPLCVLNMPYSGPTWMNDIFPCLLYRKLSEIGIPGSHDSGTYAFTFFEDGGFATTQDEDFTHQLNDGMRAFDIRVEYNATGAEGPGWYVYHGPIVSSLLTLHDIFAQIYEWAVQSSHGQEILKLNLDIEGGDDKQDCFDFGSEMGEALLTPQELSDNFGTPNPGQLTLGQLWSLADVRDLPRVIMTNIPCLNEATAAHGGPSDNGQWGPSGAYYAEQCSAYGGLSGNQAYGVIFELLPAAEKRYTEAGGIPQAYGPPEPAGNLYELDAQATPEPTADCGAPPSWFLTADEAILQALFNASGAYMNLNFLLGDFVEQTDLLKDIVFVDTITRVPDPPSLGRFDVATGQLTMYFNPPENYGTAPVTSYTVTASDTYQHGQSTTVSGASSPLTVSGLINGDVYAVTVTASNPYGTSPATLPDMVTVGAQPRFVSYPTANGIVGTAYASAFTATGTPILTFSLIKGNVPPGLALNSDGTLTGTPKTAGSYRFSVKVANLVGADGITVTMTISESSASAEITGR